jgi:hypothetical protein
MVKLFIVFENGEGNDSKESLKTFTALLQQSAVHFFLQQFGFSMPAFFILQ